MLRKSLRLRAIGTMIALLASIGVSLAVSPGTAHASCQGQSNEITDVLFISSTLWATENPVSGTCQGNGYYQTYIRSSTNGWRVSLHIFNSGSWADYYGTNYDTASYYFDYYDANSYSRISLCLDDGVTYYCGWGSTYTITVGLNRNISALNSGF